MESMPLWIFLLELFLILMWIGISAYMYIRTTTKKKPREKKDHLINKGWFKGSIHILWALSLAISVMLLIGIVIAFVT